MPEFDYPLFKRLAHNDTGAAAGHQGGVLIPRQMDEYFPQLSGRVSASSPTVDVHIQAELFLEDAPVEVTQTRYQYQTWGGTRSPERRLTGNLGPIRNEAHAGDYLIIQKSMDDPLYFRLTLLRQGTQAHSNFAVRVGSRVWGPVDKSAVPLSEIQVETAATQEVERELAPFQLFDEAASVIETRALRLARSRAFKNRVSALYDRRCAVCGRAHVTVSGASEVEAAHIVPRSFRGVDDARNGLALCRSHHWAFDRGLFGVNAAGSIIIPPDVLVLLGNSHLIPFANAKIHRPVDETFSPDHGALAWHLANVVKINSP